MGTIKIYRTKTGRFILQSCDQNVLAIGNFLAYNIGHMADFFRSLLTCTTNEIVNLETCTVYITSAKLIIENNNQLGFSVGISYSYAVKIVEAWESFVFSNQNIMILDIDMHHIECIDHAYVDLKMIMLGQ